MQLGYARAKGARDARRNPEPDKYHAHHGPAAYSPIGGAPSLLLIALSALALGGMVLWCFGKATAQIDFQLLVSALRATPRGSL
jgi:hypothetical protein